MLEIGSHISIHAVLDDLGDRGPFLDTLVQRLLFARQVGRAITQRITEYSTTENFTDSTDSQ